MVNQNQIAAKTKWYFREVTDNCKLDVSMPRERLKAGSDDKKKTPKDAKKKSELSIEKKPKTTGKDGKPGKEEESEAEIDEPTCMEQIKDYIISRPGLENGVYTPWDVQPNWAETGRIYEFPSEPRPPRPKPKAEATGKDGKGKADAKGKGKK